MMQPEEKIGEGQDVKSKEDDISQDSGDSGGSSYNYGTNLPEYENSKRWFRVNLSGAYDRDEQVALLLGFLKCDKSELCYIYQYCSHFMLRAHMTYEEADNLWALEEVEDVGMVSLKDNVQSAKRYKSGIVGARSKSKKQKLSLGSILSERRQNKEKWRYDEDLELEAKVEDSEEEDLSDEWRLKYGLVSDEVYEGYFGFDEFGKRLYKVGLLHDKTEDDEVALLRDVLKCEQSEIDSIYNYITHNLFKARMTEEEADRVAGSEEVEFVEPDRYAIYFD